MAGAAGPWIALGPAAALAALLLLLIPTAVSGSDPAPTPMDVQVRIGTVPTNLTVELDGVRRPTPYSFLCPQGTTHFLNATQIARFAFVQYVFTGWTDGNVSPYRTFVCDIAQNFTALHRGEYRVAIGTLPSGLEVVVGGNLTSTPATFWCPAGSTLDLLAFDQQNRTGAMYLFGNWSDGGPPGHPIRCDGPGNYTAAYRTLYLTSVFTEPSGLFVSVDGETFRSPYSFWCDEFTSHTLGAPTDQDLGGAQYRFERWIDGELPGARRITCTGPMNYSAIFVLVSTPLPDGGPVVAWGVLLALILVTVVPFVVAALVLTGRRPSPPVPIPMPLPAGVAPPSARAPEPARFCPQCGQPAEPAWTYCMACGSPLH